MCFVRYSEGDSDPQVVVVVDVVVVDGGSGGGDGGGGRRGVCPYLMDFCIFFRVFAPLF